MTGPDGVSSVAAGDRALVAEALRRVAAAPGGPGDPAAALRAMADMLARGRRDLFSLVKAGRGAG